MAEEKNTPFNYLLNAFEHASQEKYPAKAGYAGKRKALLAHVRELERKAAAYDALAAPAPSAPADQPSPDKQGQQGGPVVGQSASDWECVGSFLEDDGRWGKVAPEYANDPEAVKLYRKRVPASSPASATEEPIAPGDAGVQPSEGSDA